MSPKRTPIKINISSPRPLKLEKTRYFRISMPKILEKTRYFCISDPTGPLKASKCQFGPQNTRKMGFTRPPNTRKCDIFWWLRSKHTHNYAFLIHTDAIWHIHKQSVIKISYYGFLVKFRDDARSDL